MSGELELSTAFSGGIPAETLEAVQELQVKGRQFKLKGGFVLGGAAALAAISVFALVLYYQAEPASAFSVLDLPDLKEKVAAAVEQVVSTASGMPFDSQVQKILDVMAGPIGKIFSISVIGLGLATAMVTAGIMPAITAIGLALLIQFMPAVMSSLTGVPLSSESKSVKVESDGGKFIRQLVDEKRYAELVIASGELMPPGQAAYVRAQVAYLEQKPEVAKVELGKISGDTKGIKAERLAVLEKFAFGVPRSPAAIKYVQDAQESMGIRNTVHQSSGVLAMILSLVGGGILGLGLTLERRAQRLMKMLSFNGGGIKEVPRNSPVVDQRAQALEDKTKKADWVPAWQRTSDQEPVVVQSGSGGSGFVTGALVGAAAAAIVSESVAETKFSRGGDGGYTPSYGDDDSGSDGGGDGGGE